MAKPRKKVTHVLTLRLTEWEWYKIQELKKEVHMKTASGAILKAAFSYRILKENLHNQQMQIDYYNYEKQRQAI